MRKPTLVLRICLCQLLHLEGFTILFGTHFKIQSFPNCTSKKRKLSSYKINLYRKINFKFNIKFDLYKCNSKTHAKKMDICTISCLTLNFLNKLMAKVLNFVLVSLQILI